MSSDHIDDERYSRHLSDNCNDAAGEYGCIHEDEQTIEQTRTSNNTTQRKHKLN